MSARDAGRTAAAPPRAAQEEESPFRKVFGVLQVCTNRLVTTLTHFTRPLIQQILLIYAVTQFGETSTPTLPHSRTRAHRYSAGNFFGSKTPTTQPSPVIPGSSPDPVQVDPVHLSALPAKAHLAWPLGIPVSLHFHLSTDPTGQVFAEETGLPHFVWHDITFGNWSEARTVDYNVHLPEVRDL